MGARRNQEKVSRVEKKKRKRMWMQSNALKSNHC